MPSYMVGAITAPAVPASTVAYTNKFGFACMCTIYGGTVTVIAIDGVTVGLIAGAFVVPSGSTVAITYAVAPTWTWFGLG
jgi:hypothetical protein